MFLLRSVASKCTSSSTQILYNDNLYYNLPSQKVQDLLKTCRSKLQTICLRIVRSVLILAFYHAWLLAAIISTIVLIHFVWYTVNVNNNLLCLSIYSFLPWSQHWHCNLTHPEISHGLYSGLWSIFSMNWFIIEVFFEVWK